MGVISLGLAFLIKNIDIRPKPPGETGKAVEDVVAPALVAPKSV